MDDVLPTEKLNLLPIILVLVLPLIFHFFKRPKSVSSGQECYLPPGPFRWPIVGNIPQVIGSKPHVLVTSIAKKHGELICLNLGKQRVIIASSPGAASAILRIHDRQFSARYAPKATPISESDLKRFSLVWSPECSDQWKSVRVLWKSELFSAKAMEKNALMREEKVGEMVDFLRSKNGKVVNIGDVVFSCVLRTLGMLSFSREMIAVEDEGAASELRDVFWRFMEHSTTPIVPDFFPVFDGLYDYYPLSVRKKAKECLGKLFDLWRGIVQERRQMNTTDGSEQGDFLDFMIAHGFSDIQIDYMLLEIIPAGLGTEWAMAELIRNKKAMKKVYEELQTTITSSSPTIKESQVLKLPYLNACVKETLRLHPPIPFLPHSAHETCQVLSYTVPKDSPVLVNVWALGRDSKTWDRPSEFDPERFMDSNMDFKGQDFELLPFGAQGEECVLACHLLPRKLP